MTDENKPRLRYWNYRVISSPIPGTEERIFAIHEVYYDQDDNPHAFTADPAAIIGDTLEEVKESAKQIVEAFSKPVLEEESFDGR